MIRVGKKKKKSKASMQNGLKTVRRGMWNVRVSFPSGRNKSNKVETQLR